MGDGIVATIQTPFARVGFDSNRSGIGIRSFGGDASGARETDSKKSENRSEYGYYDGPERSPDLRSPTRNKPKTFNNNPAFVGALIIGGAILWMLLAFGLYDIFDEAGSRHQ
jgi:hypothetical protein